MKKIYKSVTCPDCENQNVDIKVTYKNKKQKEVTYAQEEAIEFYQERVMNCHCPNCNKDYQVNQGKDVYTVLKEPLPVSFYQDVHLLAVYDSNFEYDFKIVKVSPYNGTPITMAIVENDEYPVVLPEKEDIKDLPKVKKILFNAWMNRYR